MPARRGIGSSFNVCRETIRRSLQGGSHGVRHFGGHRYNSHRCVHLLFSRLGHSIVADTASSSLTAASCDVRGGRSIRRRTSNFFLLAPFLRSLVHPCCTRFGFTSCGKLCFRHISPTDAEIHQSQCRSSPLPSEKGRN